MFLSLLLINVTEPILYYQQVLDKQDKLELNLIISNVNSPDNEAHNGTLPALPANRVSFTGRLLFAVFNEITEPCMG